MNSVLVLVLLLASAEPAAGTAAVSTGEAARDSVLFVHGGPVHLRLHVTLNARSLPVVRREYAQRLLTTLDTNQDGKLTREEAAQSPLLRTRQRESAREFLKSIGANEKPLALRELELMLERYGGETVVYRQEMSAAEPDRKVFEFLDDDKNGVLSADEMSQAAERMLSKDLDRDQCITFDEFAPPPEEPTDLVVRLTQTPAKSTAGVAEMLRDMRDPNLGRRLVQHYDRDRNQVLAAEELGWSRERVATLDQNQDEKLSASELAKIISMQPDLELRVELLPAEGTSASLDVLTPGLQRLDGAERPDFVKVRLRDAVLSISHRQIDPLARSLEAATRVFNRLDLDGNGYLEMAEVKDSVRFERGLFELMDVDSDGKVFGDEMKRYVVVRGEPAANTCRVNLYDTGFGFFLTLDRNGDGRISERERRTLGQALATLDRDGIAGVAASEPVRHFHLELVRGSYQLFGAPEQTVVQTPAFQRRPPVGPSWFQAMDRNNDGDLSWEEFQAPRHDFDHIDHDEDGLIDPQEATTADEEYQRASGHMAER